MRKWQTLSHLFQHVRTSHIERSTPPTFVKRGQEEQLNKRLTARYEEMKKQAASQMNYSLGMKSKPFEQRQKEQAESAGGPFSLTNIVQNV